MLAATLFMLIPSQANAAGQGDGHAPLPSTWSAFKASTDPRDRQVVARVVKMEWGASCIAWGRETRSGKAPRLQAALREHLIDLQSINGIDLMHVKERDVAIGMSLCGVAAVFGHPGQSNQTHTAIGHHVQLVYPNRHTYVYLDGIDQGDLLVTAIQN